MQTARTLYEKLWGEHTVTLDDDGSALLYIDAHLVHEVTSPQAFEGLRTAGRSLWRKSSVLAVPDHAVPTTDRSKGIKDASARAQLQALDDNCRAYALPYIPLHSSRQGIVHIVGPEQGFTLPGMTLVCGDSHTSTHGALACLAMGIGTSEVEHVMATQCLWTKKQKNMRIDIEGDLQQGVQAKDIILHVIGTLGTAGGTGYAIEYSGNTVRKLSMEGRMTVCNMTIEAGARCGMVACDAVTLEYISDRCRTISRSLYDLAESSWMNLQSDRGACFDKIHSFSATDIAPQVTWGTSPEMVVSVSDCVPDPQEQSSAAKRESQTRALQYMGLPPGMPIRNMDLDRVFIGSCTNSRIEDLRSAAKVVCNRRVAKSIRQAMVVPGSGLVKRQAESEGLDRIFKDAGFEWRLPGCSMCIAMNPDRLLPGERCASTSNRNFEGRQGRGGRTHLVSPAMAAAAAISGRFVDIREWHYR